MNDLHSVGQLKHKRVSWPLVLSHHLRACVRACVRTVHPTSGSVPHLLGGRVENYFGKTTLSTPDQESNLDLPGIDNPFYCESSALDHAAIKTDGGREGERCGVASQPTKVSFRANKNRWITETVDGASYQTALAEKSYVWKCQFSRERHDMTLGSFFVYDPFGLDPEVRVEGGGRAVSQQSTIQGSTGGGPPQSLAPTTPSPVETPPPQPATPTTVTLPAPPVPVTQPGPSSTSHQGAQSGGGVASDHLVQRSMSVPAPSHHPAPRLHLSSLGQGDHPQQQQPRTPAPTTNRPTLGRSVSRSEVVKHTHRGLSQYSQRIVAVLTEGCPSSHRGLSQYSQRIVPVLTEGEGCPSTHRGRGLSQYSQRVSQYPLRKRVVPVLTEGCPSRYIKRETAVFFGVEESCEKEQQERWLNRRKRLATRKYGPLREGVAPPRTPTTPSPAPPPTPHITTSAYATQQSRESRPDVLPSAQGRDSTEALSTPRWSEPPVRRKESVAKMTFGGLAFVVADSNLNLPVIGGPIYCESDALNHSTTETG
uniref:(California timema) hypothetical protein n=1 Tax=Timema californicum TaxID=61474 RepID=A0A7R9J1A0_TIMCA|nr:unnamed protein product [Timema californicum]